MNEAMKIKQLQLNVDKCGVIIFGSKKKAQLTKNEIETMKCLTINGQEVKVKSQDKYLSDYLHSDGLAKSVEVTIS